MARAITRPPESAMTTRAESALWGYAALFSTGRPLLARSGRLHNDGFGMSAPGVLAQPVDAALYLEGEMECTLMSYRFHRGFTAAEKTELWDRWKRGMSLKAIGRAFGKQSSAIYCTVAMLAFFAISGLLFDLDQRFRCAHA
jgi:hypothetical protein